MFSKILVANRGEIALRVIRACKEADIKSIAVYSEADSESLHLQLADETVCIGPGPSAKSYLNIDAIVQAAKDTGADAVHPGYGYLAEKAEFAIACAENGLVFIGPTPENLSMAGDKIAGKRAMVAADVPVIPSSPGGIPDIEAAKTFCKEIGYPVMIKASAGGGGRGIRICQNEEELAEEFPVARMEAKVAFANDEIFIERFITQPRHIEFQILADQHGNVIHLGERECTIQRRYQKLIEEAPSPALTPELRKSMGDAAIRAAKAINYVNAGTVEFLLDPNGNFFFIEINSRIQVEHPVTELTTGIDLVREQIELAAGKRLDYDYDSLTINTWAIECRINAEDPERGFMPSPGTIKTYRPPGGIGVRLDTHLYEGYELPIFYDSMVAKLISYSSTREGAIRIMKRALAEFKVTPLKTTIPLYLQVMNDPDFQAGNFDTSYIGRFVPDDEDDDDDEDD